MNVKTFAGLVALVGAAGCYREVSSPAQPVSYGWSNPEPTTVAGPPGGGADPGYDQQSPDQPGYPQGYPDGYPGGYPAGTEYGQDAPDATPTPYDDPGATGSVNDSEIDSTLNGYGEWVEDDDYGRIWRPYTTVVGVDFTPYESCGTWVYTDFGWTFSCTDWSWGWLAFHYGNWAWFDDFGWGWCPGYAWSPAWVDWRDGGGYVGWRPTPPRVRDHRHHDAGPQDPTVRDHRHHRIANHDSNWRFASVNDLGKSHIRAHTYKNVADGLRLTSVVSTPSVKGPRTATAAQVMQDRQRIRQRVQGNVYRPDRQQQPSVGPPQRPSVQQPTYQPPRPQQPTYRPPQPTYQPPRPGVQQPTYQPPRPQQPTYQPPRPTYQPPSRPTYQPPSRPTYQPPSRPTYSPPSRPTYSPPATTHYSGGSHSSGSYSAPSHSSPSHSSSSSSSSSSHSSSSSSSSSHSSGRHK